MNNYKFNKKAIKKYLKRGFALISATFVVASFSGCSEEFIEKGFEPDDASIVASNVEEINRIRREEIISECIKEGRSRHLSDEEINDLINEKLDKEHLLKKSEKENCESSLNSESSYVEEETSVYSYN